MFYYVKHVKRHRARLALADTSSSVSFPFVCKRDVYLYGTVCLYDITRKFEKY
jgi:hypothetical protein